MQQVYCRISTARLHKRETQKLSRQLGNNWRECRSSRFNAGVAARIVWRDPSQQRQPNERCRRRQALLPWQRPVRSRRSCGGCLSRIVWRDPSEQRQPTDRGRRRRRGRRRLRGCGRAGAGAPLAPSHRRTYSNGVAGLCRHLLGRPLLDRQRVHTRRGKRC